MKCYVSSFFFAFFYHIIYQGDKMEQKNRKLKAYMNILKDKYVLVPADSFLVAKYRGNGRIEYVKVDANVQVPVKISKINFTTSGMAYYECELLGRFGLVGQTCRDFHQNIFGHIIYKEAPSLAWQKYEDHDYSDAPPFFWNNSVVPLAPQIYNSYEVLQYTNGHEKETAVFLNSLDTGSVALKGLKDFQDSETKAQADLYSTLHKIYNKK